MVTAGDAFLQNALNGDENTPLTVSNATTGGSGKHAAPVPDGAPDSDTQIDEATREARDREVRRVGLGPLGGFFALGDDTEGGGGGGSGPGGYKFDAETIAKKITEWEDVLHDIQTDGQRIQRARGVIGPPSGDEPAHQQVKDAKASLQAADNQNQAMQEYAKSYIAALHKANGTYAEYEKQVTGDLTGNGSFES